MTQDDHYKNYLIPKGATIMANNWAISRDESMFPDAEAFRPERWLDDAGKALRTDGTLLHPMKFAFGFGHRTCPGRYLADALLFSHYCHILKVFDVALPVAVEKAKIMADEKMKVKSNGAAWCGSSACGLFAACVAHALLTAESRKCTSHSRPARRRRRLSSTKRRMRPRLRLTGRLHSSFRDG